MDEPTSGYRQSEAGVATPDERQQRSEQAARIRQPGAAGVSDKRHAELERMEREAGTGHDTPGKSEPPPNGAGAAGAGLDTRRGSNPDIDKR